VDITHTKNTMQVNKKTVQSCSILEVDAVDMADAVDAVFSQTENKGLK